eukprot:GHRQ01021740.1.p1 GENE.GHRQ01021740.1~~GHRQ01021740.1.p1  ORF type:complete len:268 (+),score=76.83 GHRQ01021740.1:94-897(+)
MLHSSRWPASGLCASQIQRGRPIRQRLLAMTYTGEYAKQDPALIVQQRQQAATTQQGVLAAAERLDLDEVWVPYRWPGELGGDDVYLSGNWCEWKEKHVRLRQCGSTGSYPGDWVALFKMQTGQHEYKFNVDGGWRVAPADPLVMDPEGNINNKRLCVKNCHIEFCFSSSSPVARAPRTAVSVIGAWSNWRVWRQHLAGWHARVTGGLASPAGQWIGLCCSKMSARQKCTPFCFSTCSSRHAVTEQQQQRPYLRIFGIGICFVAGPQ